MQLDMRSGAQAGASLLPPLVELPTKLRPPLAELPTKRIMCRHAWALRTFAQWKKAGKRSLLSAWRLSRSADKHRGLVWLLYIVRIRRFLFWLVSGAQPYQLGVISATLGFRVESSW